MGEILKELAGPSAAHVGLGGTVAQTVFIRMCDKALDYTGETVKGVSKAKRGLYTQKRANLAAYVYGDADKVHNLSRPIQELIRCGLIERLDRGKGPIVQNFRIRLPEFVALNFTQANGFLEGSKHNGSLIRWQRIGEDYEGWLHDELE